MGRVRAGVDVPDAPEDVEGLWYDLNRWPAFMDGFHHLEKAEGGWPATGGRLVWQSTPAGRGRVVERVLEQEPGRGQAVEVEDPRLRGTQRVAFAPLEDGTAVDLELDYELKQRTPVQPLVDLLFIRRALRDSLRRTLSRFARELAADREMLR
jgi:hypothetical protein